MSRARTLAIAGALLGSTLVVACSGAHFHVQVRDARDRRPIADASVLLYERGGDPCSDGAVGGQLSDASGTAHVSGRWCGRSTLVVAAAGYETLDRALDSCEAERVEVILTPLEPEPPADEAATRAREFLAALWARRAAALKALLADASQLPLYLEGGAPSRSPRTAVRSIHASDGENPAREFRVYSANGCRQPWCVRLARDGDVWRVAGAAPQPCHAR